MTHNIPAEPSSLCGRLWQRECALLTACSTVTPEWWERSTSCGGGYADISEVEGHVDPEFWLHQESHLPLHEPHSTQRTQRPPASFCLIPHTGSHLWLVTRIWQMAERANERGTVVSPCGSSMILHAWGLTSKEWKYAISLRPKESLSKRFKWRCDFSTGRMRSIDDCAAEFLLFLAAFFLSFLFFVSLFLVLIQLWAASYQSLACANRLKGASSVLLLLPQRDK